MWWVVVVCRHLNFFFFILSNSLTVIATVHPIWLSVCPYLIRNVIDRSLSYLVLTLSKPCYKNVYKIGLTKKYILCCLQRQNTSLTRSDRVIAWLPWQTGFKRGDTTELGHVSVPHQYQLPHCLLTDIDFVLDMTSTGFHFNFVSDLCF